MPINITHRVRRSLVCLLAVLLLSSSPAMAGYLYVLNVQNGAPARIYGYDSDPETGALSPLAGFPVTTSAIGTGNLLSESMAVDSENARLYIVNDGPNTLSVYAIDTKSGALTEMPYSPVQLPVATWATVAVHPSGSPVIVGGSYTSSSGVAASFNVDEDGVIGADGSPFSLGRATAFSSSFSADGNFYYAGGYALTSLMSGHAVDAATGIMTALAGSPFNSGGSRPRGFAAHPDGRLFLVDSGSKMRAYTTSAGVPTGVAGNPFNAVSGSIDSVAHPGGGYILSVGTNAGQVAAYQITGSGQNTTPTPVSAAPTGGSYASMLTMTRTGDLVFAGNSVSRNVAAFRFDDATGALTLLGVQPASTQGNTGALAGIALFEPVVAVTQTPEEAIQAIIDTINGYDPPLSRGMSRSLIAKLENALVDLEKGEIAEAMDKMGAFINHVRAQTGKALGSERAAELTAAAEAVIGMLESQLPAGDEKTETK
ncbi:MAG: beta-propeller fold lactonase family protein [Pyrinomonadaceae bacterium]|nr:beta-propeller fold lactonase family protein [Pyrinomonadaceae bacterium]